MKPFKRRSGNGSLQENNWQPRAKAELFEILEFYQNRNGSSKYGERVFEQMVHRLSFIGENWQFGERVNKENVRRTIVEHFALYYLITPESVDILSVRDARRKPK